MSPANGSATRMSPLEQEVVDQDDGGYCNRDDVEDSENDDHNTSRHDIHHPQESFSSSSSASTSSHTGPTNESLLGTAFLSFLSFALLELVFAVIAGSDAMMADGASMIVDSMTYLANFLAERKKQLYNDNEAFYIVYSMQDTVVPWERYKRKQILRLELISPLLSVSTLLVITVMVMHKAISTLVLDLHRSRSEQSIPNVNLMIGFSFFNLLLDCFNMYCFARSKHLLGFATVEDTDESLAVMAKQRRRQRSSYLTVKMGDDSEDDHDEDGGRNNGEPVAAPTGLVVDGRLPQGHDDRHHHHRNTNHQHANLNMCSAYTHVFADTMRSIAVLIAAGLAKLVPGVSSEEADATAAVFVSIMIVLSLVPLFHGLWRSFSELQAIADLERHDVAMQRSPRNSGQATDESPTRRAIVVSP